MELQDSAPPLATTAKSPARVHHDMAHHPDLSTGPISSSNRDGTQAATDIVHGVPKCIAPRADTALTSEQGSLDEFHMNTRLRRFVHERLALGHAQIFVIATNNALGIEDSRTCSFDTNDRRDTEP